MSAGASHLQRVHGTYGILAEMQSSGSQVEDPLRKITEKATLGWNTSFTTRYLLGKTFVLVHGVSAATGYVRLPALSPT